MPLHSWCHLMLVKKNQISPKHESNCDYLLHTRVPNELVNSWGPRESFILMLASSATQPEPGVTYAQEVLIERSRYVTV